METLALLNMTSTCVCSDEELYEHMRLAILRELPEIGTHPEHGTVAVMVASGPSLTGQIDSIRKERERGRPIIAIKGAHDFLIEHGIVPDYAVAIDPQEDRWTCFSRKHKQVRYMIASQCHPAMFNHLRDMQVFLWHTYIKKGQDFPKDRHLIAGGTTTGLRAITLFYTMGWRQFELYGYDSCLKDGVLRFDGSTSWQAQVIPVVVGGEKFLCNPSMAAQAKEFERCYDVMPDARITAHGGGLISKIIEERAKLKPLSVSFIHSGGPRMASYRYRSQIPASQLANCTLNDLSADVLVFSKPMANEVAQVEKARALGKRVVVDFCDDHFYRPEYRSMAVLADAVVAPTFEMARIVHSVCRKPVHVIPDPYEFERVAPHVSGVKLLWFGHAVNWKSLERVRPQLAGYDLTVVSNVYGSEPWSHERMLRAFAEADIVILPATATHKSANRAVEAIRQGCFVVAEPHPALDLFPGIWIGDLKEGIEWTKKNRQEANWRLSLAQSYVERMFAPLTLALAWKTAIVGPNSTSAAAEFPGTDGSTLISTAISPMSAAICDNSPRFPMAGLMSRARSMFSSIFMSGRP